MADGASVSAGTLVFPTVVVLVSAVTVAAAKKCSVSSHGYGGGAASVVFVAVRVGVGVAVVITICSLCFGLHGFRLKRKRLDDSPRLLHHLDFSGV